MKINQILGLNKSQAELDFVDIDIGQDLPLFIDPFFLSIKRDNWSVEATLTIKSFFDRLVNLIRNNNEPEAKALFAHLSEPNSTCLGMSMGDPRGRGVGDTDAVKIYESLLKSRAIQTGLIRDIEDNILFVDNFGKDKLSDMTTNIITKHLIQYTQNQCNLHNIPLRKGVTSGYFWSRADNAWISEYTEMLVINNKKILLVPKGIVSFSKSYTPTKYYEQFVLDYLQNEHLTLGSALVQKRKDGTPYVTKKSVEEENPFSKTFLRKFTQDHPEVLQQFKEETDVNSIPDSDLTGVSLRSISSSLIARLQSIPSGSESASDFHNIIIGILEILFYPQLINPVKEREIHDGRKRIDLTFDNASKRGIFQRLSHNMNIPCPYIFIECKNYTRDVANPELDQLSGRFSTNRGKVGFLVCRNIDNMDVFLSRCRDTFSDGRGLIIPLVDQDLVKLLQNVNDGENEYTEQFLSDRIREVTIN
ncbi:hypothetical protein POKO110462_20160 [Pontibacter korlensis]|uniref:Restriction endonuclease type IV Mrr domain-containing protein n=1 Tax=Pontibacter korlensis TaxID=400092 RepID=A0A0E3ZI20_9BACT|nr:hypothetical protein [Pontibacter korlensis]AKD04373.1 hypothetical protein PKOR_16365 [Pontibacter korlensis]